MSNIASQPRRRSWSATANPGKRCPPVPPQRDGDPDRLLRGRRHGLRLCALGKRVGCLPSPARHSESPPSVSRACRAMLSKSPTLTKHDQQIRSAVADERQRQAFVRQRAGDDADVDEGLQANQKGNPRAEQQPEGVGRVHGNVDAAKDNRRQRQRPPAESRSDPSSSPMMEKMKSVWCSGTKPSFWRPSPRPLPARPPLPSATIAS